MLQPDLERLPTGDELVSSDDSPVDNEDQNFIPNVLLFLLEYIWKQRQDWFFAVDMGVYHATSAHPKFPVVPDGFLSLGIERRKQGGRKSYVVWEENNVAPILTLEVVSQTPGGEYDEKMAIYARLGVLYYVIYNPLYWRRDRQLPFEVYKLVNGNYRLQVGEPFWMPEIRLGIGRSPLPDDPLGREVLSWFDVNGQRYLNEAEAERQRAEQLADRLRQLGEDA
jgi:Uma2 family endonuclease